jgi:acetyl-CoA synthetase
MRPLPGISAKIVDDNGNELAPAVEHGEPVTG